MRTRYKQSDPENSRLWKLGVREVVTDSNYANGITNFTMVMDDRVVSFDVSQDEVQSCRSADEFFELLESRLKHLITEN